MEEESKRKGGRKRRAEEEEEEKEKEKEKKNGEDGDLQSTNVLLFDPIQKHYLQLLLRFALPNTMAL